MVPDIAPEYTVFSGGFRDSPEWGSASVMNPAWLLAWYSDLEIINATYATAQRYVDYLLSQRDARGLLSYGLGDWIPVANSPAGVTGTGQLVQDLQALARAATALGRPAESANYTALAASAAAAFERAFFSPTGAAYPTQCAAGYALSLGFATDAAAAQAYLVNDVRTYGAGNITTSGEVGNVYALRALADAPGGPDAVWASLLRTTSPGYGWMLTMGETALAESWTDARGDSHLHAMYGHIDEYLYAHVAGIRQAPGSSGWRRVLFAPNPPPAEEGAGAFVRATFESPRGLIASHARVLDAAGAVELELTCPPGVECAARLPRSGRVVDVPATGRPHVLRD
jgi:alpha-L-rhamnosidase